ncbi:Meckelin [Phlyctochytrium arcticum]|nr:Meckelin [Phlyctochytrium arcticum]
MKSAVRCMVQDDVTSCEQLANLCVLAFYDLTTAACQIYQSILRTKAPTVGSADIPYGYPWLVYGWLSGQDTMAFTNSILNMDIDISAGSNSSSIPLFVNIFGQNGSFIGQQQVLEQFQTCTTAENSADWRSIGHNYIARCNVNIADLSRSSEPVLFYDLYVRDRTGALVPAPIRITNYRTTSNRQSNVNANPVDYSSSVLFRRFFGFDSRSGVENGVLKVFRVPTGFEFWIRKVPDTGRIYIPVLDVTYAERDVSILSTGDASLVSSPEFIYTATYIMDLSSFWRIATIIFALVCVAAGLMAFYAARGWSMRNLTSYERWDVNFLSRCVLILAGCLAPFLFLLLLVASAYILFTYKTQSTLGSFLPWTDADVSRFRAILIITLVCQCANVLMLLYQQCEVDIFFIDWERSRGRILRTGGEGKPKLATVSVWRSIFAMNEWDKMQTYRRVNIEFSILAMYFVFQGLRLRNLATAQPNLSDLSPGLISPILLFGAQCIVWIALALAQVLFHVMFFDRFYKNRLLDFVDVLSMANLSILAFDELCHGYYIHGRTVHPCADTNIAELNAFLRREQADLVPRRGLQDTDQQCFEVFAQKDMRSAFNKVYNIVIAEQEDPGRDVATRLQRMSADKRSRPFFGAEESRVRAYETVNHFVRNFFDKNMKDFNYFIRERTGLERFLGVTPNVSTSTVMFHTPSSYGRLLLYGIEHHLLILYVVIFSLADYGLDSTGAAAVITYAVDVILRIARRHFGGNNLARKTMLDKKFLI